MDKDRNIYESVGVRGNKIQALGNNSQVLLSKKEGTKIIDLKGRTVLPGFNDSHMHLVNYGYSLTQVNLLGIRSIDEIKERVNNFIKDNNL